MYQGLRRKRSKLERMNERIEKLSYWEGNPDKVMKN